MSDPSWAEIKRQVRERAQHYCEYCHTCEENSGQTLHVDHIDPIGGDDLENLCLSCWNCNTSKSDVTEAPDPQTDDIVPLFNPRAQTWLEHFRWGDNGSRIEGITATGRATTARFKMNRPQIVTARQRWALAGFHPPKMDRMDT
jgi:hypothetical protein